MKASAEFSLLQFERPDGALWAISVLLLDRQNDELYVRNRGDLSSLDEVDAELVRDFLNQLASETGTRSGAAILRQFEDSLSNAIRISERHSIPVDDFHSCLDQLATEYLS